MKGSHGGYSARWKPFLGILLGACFLATAAHANSLFTGTFKLTDEVHWGNAVLGPGAYSLALDQSTQTIIIRDASTGKVVAREFANPDYYKADRADSKLLVAVRGRQHVVYSVQVAGFGKIFQQAHPFATSRRAAEEARNAEAIPIEVAQK